jgi:hypothetical protein
MIIRTGVKGSPARPASPAVPPATPPGEAGTPFVPPTEGNFMVEGLELSSLTASEAKALDKALKKAASASPVGKGAVKGLELWLSAEKTVTAFRARDGSWFAVLDAGIGAASDLAALIALIAPAIAENRVFRIADDSLTFAGEVCKVYTAATATDPPLLPGSAR